MQEVKKSFEQAIQQKLAQIKGTSITYGEDKRVITQLYMGTRDPLESTIFKEVEKRLVEEMNQLKII